jgi:hypothetical protein
MTRKQIEAALASARALVASLEAALEDAGNDPTELLDVAMVKEEYNIGRDALKAAAHRGELTLTRGPRGRLQVERGKLEAWQRSRKYEPTQRRPVADLEAWKAEADRCIEGSS